MKHSFKLLLYIFTLPISLLLSSCASEYDYQFSKRSGDIQSIEIVWFSPQQVARQEEYLQTEADCTVDATDWSNLLTELDAIAKHRQSLDPPDLLSGYTFRITYSNGDVDMISACYGECLIDGQWYKEPYLFDEELFQDLVMTYYTP